ncbi:MAG: hypothetical protein OZ921_18435 [Sorangiineae bacterium]|nr:hypothetical protein [Polyangiaceae bacterium]MEB2324499.1 hypothetical protein [Sorangiineae bacterium]
MSPSRRSDSTRPDARESAAVRPGRGAPTKNQPPAAGERAPSLELPPALRKRHLDATDEELDAMVQTWLERDD